MNQKSPNQRVSRLEINPSSILKFDKRQKLDKGSDHRVLIIENFDSFGEGFLYFVNDFSKYYINKFPFAFVIVLSCESSSFGAYGNVKENLKNTFNSNRPLIVVFKHMDRTGLAAGNHNRNKSDNFLAFYKDCGSKSSFTRMDGNFTDKNSNKFGAFMKNLENGSFGIHSGTFEGITVDSQEKLQNLMDRFGMDNDLLGIRFLHLFYPDLIPSDEVILHMMEHGSSTCTKLDVFCALYDYNYKYQEDISSVLYTRRVKKAKVSKTIHIQCKNGKSIEFEDDGSENYLMLAVRCKNKEVVDFLLRSGMHGDVMNSRLETAANLAFSSQYYDILTLLLLANSRYPRYFETPKLCGKQLKNLVAATAKLHKLIESFKCRIGVKSSEDQSQDETLDFSEIDKLLDEYPKLDHWYDTKNQSAVTKSIRLRKFPILIHLRKRHLFMGKLEDVTSIIENLTLAEKNEVFGINLRNLDKPALHHIFVLFQQSGIHSSSKEDEKNLNFTNAIHNAYLELEQNELIQKVLELIAAHCSYQGCGMVFDFHRNTVNAVDFQSPNSVNGIFYPHSLKIVIGAKDLLNKDNYDEALGVLVHELHHRGIMLIFKNDCKPYLKNSAGEKEFTNISVECEKKKSFEPLIESVYNYPVEKQHAELIVRVPQLLMKYRNNPKRLQEVKEKFKTLFDLYENIIISMVPDKTKEIILENENLISWANQVWDKQLRKQRIVNCLFGIGIFGLITFAIFLINILSTYESCLNNVNETCVWNNLQNETRENIFNTRFECRQNERLREILSENETFFELLSDTSIRIPSKIDVCNAIPKLLFAFFDTKLVKSDALPGFSTNNEACYSYKKHDIVEIDSIKGNGNIRLISSEAQGGTTTFLLHQAGKESENKPLSFTFYLDFGTENVASETFQNWNRQHLQSFIINKLGYEIGTFKSEMIRKQLKKGNVILFLDHIDRFLAKDKDLATKFLESLIEFSHKNTEIWIGTRKASSDDIANIIRSKLSSFNSHYKIVPLYCENQTKFINEAVNSSDLKKLQKIKAITRINELLKKVLEIWRYGKTFTVGNIGLLRIIVDHAIESVKSDRTKVNLYSILKEYAARIVLEKFDKKGEEVKKLNDLAMEGLKSVYSAIGLRKLQFEFPSIFENIDVGKLIENWLKGAENSDILINSTWNMNNFKIKTGIETGLLLDDKENGLKFLHRIIFEYYLANYVTASIFLREAKTIKNDEIFRMNLRLLLRIYMDSTWKFPVVQNIIEYAVEQIEAIKIAEIVNDQSFKDIFNEEYSKAFNGTDIKVKEKLKKLFGKDLVELKVV